MIQIKKRIRRLLPLFIVLLSGIVALTGCYDLGSFQDGKEEGYRDYYDAFDDVVALYAGGVYTYDVEDSLYNEFTVNHFDWEDDDDAVESEEYVYLAIPFAKEMTVESVALFFEGAPLTTLTVYAFFLPDGTPIPTSFYKYDDPPRSGGAPEGEEPPCDDPSVNDAIAVGNVTVVEGRWNDLQLTFGRNGTEKLTVTDGDVLLLRIENNTGYGRDAGLDRCEFRFTNLLVRAE